MTMPPTSWLMICSEVTPVPGTLPLNHLLIFFFRDQSQTLRMYPRQYPSSRRNTTNDVPDHVIVVRNYNMLVEGMERHGKRRA